MNSNHKYQDILTQMSKFELISSEEYQFLKNKEGEFEEALAPFPDYPVVIPLLLCKISKGIIRDAESGRIPPDYKRIVTDVFKLIEHDTGHPTINLHYQEKEEANHIYSLTIQLMEKEFKKELIDAGDYYDVLGLLTLINEILNFKGVDYRLISLDSDDQSFWWIKGNKEKVVQFLEWYDLEDYLEI